MTTFVVVISLNNHQAIQNFCSLLLQLLNGSFFFFTMRQITSMFRCATIQGMDTAEGLFLFGKEHFYVVDGVTLLSTKEIKDIDSLPQG